MKVLQAVAVDYPHGFPYFYSLIDCMMARYYMMLYHNVNDQFVNKNYRKHKNILASVRAYGHITNVYGLQLDYQYFRPANISNLDPKEHITKLLSTFSCHDKPLTVVVMLTSHPRNTERRHAVRTTWGKNRSDHVNDDFRVFFVVAKDRNVTVMNNLYKESNTHKDIVFGEHYESFETLPWKTEMMLEWSYKHCRADYLLKSDDDIFVNMSNLFKLIATVDKRKVYVGFRSGVLAALAHRSCAIKYSVTWEAYSFPYLPTHATGGGILLSRDLVRDVIPYLVSGVDKPPLHLEDVSLALLLLNVNIQPSHNPHFRHSMEDTCTNNSTAITIHTTEGKTSECMEKIFKEVLRSNVADKFMNLHYTKLSI